MSADGVRGHALPAELTIYTVGEWYPRCLDWARADSADETSSDELALDGAGVQEVDAAGLQLLLALANGLSAQQRRLRLAQPSAALAAACGVLGVPHLLGGTAADAAR